MLFLFCQNFFILAHQNAMVKRKVIPITLILVCVLLFIYLVNRFLIPSSLEPGDYTTSMVDYGPVFTSVPASGIVNPENEVLLLGPASSLVSSISQAPGSHIAKGEIILALDPKSLSQEIDNLKDQLGVMENDLQKNRLNARSIRVDLDYNAEVKNLRISSLKTEIVDQEQLLKVGGISPALHEQTKEELILAEKDLKMTLEKNSIRLKQLEAEEKGLQLQIDIRNKELELKQELFKKLIVRAPSDGIILGIYTSVGERVEKDKLLVKMSDLSTFKIKGSVDNRYLDDVKTGGEVYAVVEHTRLKGKIGNVSPVIKDKKIDFDVFLDYSHYQKLVPNMEVELQIVTQQKDSVLRIEHGPAFNKNKHQDLYVVRTGKAVRQTVVTGLLGTEYVEIVSGLQKGDRVIISDISRLRHKREIVFEDL
jgi:HlyD family secretion protein